jgi:hypothetical protein
MTEQYVYVPGTKDTFVELSKTPTGKLYRKHLLRYGDFAHPNLPDTKLSITEDTVDKIIQNFDNGVCDIVQVPIVGEKNQHTEDPRDNAGEVIRLEKEPDGLYAVIDARKHAGDFGKTLIGASAMLHMDYKDTRTGERVGPTLLHAAVTNRPFITDLNGFEEIIAASADTQGDEVVVLSPTSEAKETQMPELEGATREDLLAALKQDHELDVEALESELADATAALSRKENEGPSVDDMVVAFSSALEKVGVKPQASGDDGELTIKDVAEAVVEVAQEKVLLSNRINELEKEREADREAAAEKEVESLIQAGRILPKQKEAMTELALTNRPMFESLLPEDSLIELSQTGVTTFEETHSEDAEKELARLSDMANEMAIGKSPRKRGE